MLAAENAHQANPIAQVVLQGPCDAAAQIGTRRLISSAAGSGADQALIGHLDQILPFHQRGKAPGHDRDNGIGGDRCSSTRASRSRRAEPLRPGDCFCGQRGKRGKPSEGRRRTPHLTVSLSAETRTPDC